MSTSIPTGIFLAFVALTLSLLAVTDGVPSDCGEVTSTSFPPQDAQIKLTSFLGERCKHYNSTTKGLDGTWIGYQSKYPQNCTVCCARKDEKGNHHYSVMKAPKNFPCGKKKICNTNGSCVNNK
uniref:Putative secreted protein n=2 Tax=Ixodes ricinus TaxID=34613 RepID=V5H0Z7_IXORI